jgi:hypothetical protein
LKVIFRPRPPTRGSYFRASRTPRSEPDRKGGSSAVSRVDLSEFRQNPSVHDQPYRAVAWVARARCIIGAFSCTDPVTPRFNAESQPVRI